MDEKDGGKRPKPKAISKVPKFTQAPDPPEYDIDTGLGNLPQSEIKRIDYKYWLKRPSWTIAEGACLIAGRDPKAYKDSSQFSCWDGTDEEINKIKELAEICAIEGELQINKYQRIKSVLFMQWAKNKGYYVPKAFEKMAKKMDTSTHEIPPYLDPKHEHYCRELAVAVMAWTAIYDEGGQIDIRRADREKITEWLTNNYKEQYDLSEKGIQRIRLIINPKPEGGAKPTG